MVFKSLIVAILFFGMGGTLWAGTITGKVNFIGKPRRHAVVSLMGVVKKADPPVEHAVINQKGQMFIPSLLPILKGTTVEFPNNDTVYHNVYSISPGNDFLLEKYEPGKSPRHRFNIPGKVDVFCNFHSQMYAMILVFDHTYFAQTDQKGKYEINDVPEGSYRIKAWAKPRFSEKRDVTVEATGTVKADFDITREPK